MSRFGEMMCSAVAQGQPFALGVIAGTKGSSPQKQGAKALFFYDGRIEGTLGGGCLEAEIRDRARRALLTGEPAKFDLVLDHVFGWDDGLICGGRVEGLILPKAAEAADVWRSLVNPASPVTWGVRADYQIALLHSDEPRDGWLYTETVSPPSPLWIAGSGHVAQAVAKWAVDLDFACTIFDDRPELANEEFFPSGTAFRVGYWTEILRTPFPVGNVFGLIVTRGHQHDALALRSWIKHPFSFLGMIGSRRKAGVIFGEFVEQRLATPTELERVICPVGLNIGSRSVSEIALSILAQMVEQRAMEREGSSAQRKIAADVK